jgi:RHS repeat-associated protein
VQQALRYRAFGELTALTLGGAAPANRLRYTGREQDPETNLYYYRARYYDPSVGRFISEDPLGFEAGDPNFYAYVGNNPINANDPSGLAGIPGGAKAWFVSKFGNLLTDSHHMVPTEVLKSLPAEVANNPAVRGVAGAPNKWPIPRDLHQTIHNTAEIGGQRYNEAFKAEVQAIRDIQRRDPTVEEIVGIRDGMAKTYGLLKANRAFLE